MTVTLTHYARPWTINAERSGRHAHWSVTGRMTREWREAFGLLAMGQLRHKMKAADITVEIVMAKGPLPDCGANYTAIKAAIDGIVDAGLLPGDGPEHVRSITMHAPVKGKQDRMTIRLEEA